MRGFSLIESLVSLSLVSITLVSLSQGVHTAFFSAKRVVRESLGFELARKRLEELEALPTASLTTTLNGTSTVSSGGVRFTVQTTVVVNTDNSRTVTVLVTGTAGMGGNCTLTQTFSELGNT